MSAKAIEYVIVILQIVLSGIGNRELVNPALVILYRLSWIPYLVSVIDLPFQITAHAILKLFLSFKSPILVIQDATIYKSYQYSFNNNSGCWYSCYYYDNNHNPLGLYITILSRGNCCIKTKGLFQPTTFIKQISIHAGFKIRGHICRQCGKYQ